MARALVTATWDDVPHLSEDAKADLIQSYLPHEIEARTLGIPSLGHGAVYPLAQRDYVCAPFRVPETWPRAFGLDVGWNWTAAVWWAWDQTNGLEYIYREYQRRQAPPDVHVTAIKQPGDWIPGCIDPASKTRSQRDGRMLLTDYLNLGLKLALAENAVDAGILKCYDGFSSGRLKIFRNCTQLLEDLRFYHRNQLGQIVKEQDHLPDALRYVVMTGPEIAKCRPVPPPVMTSTSEWAWG